MPEMVIRRLYEELKIINAGGWAFRYLLAKMVADKLEELRAFHGNGGINGVSFAAFLAGITEINPLPLNYRCPMCHQYTVMDGIICIPQRRKKSN